MRHDTRPAAHYAPGRSRGAEAHCEVCGSPTGLRLVDDHFECIGAHDQFALETAVRRVLEQLALEIYR